MSDKEKGKYPAFMFYPMDFCMDDKVLAMPNEVVGIYIKLLCHDWINDGIDMKNEFNLMVRVGFAPHYLDGSDRGDNDHATIMDHILGCFMRHPKKRGFHTNPRLYKYRQELKQKSLTASINGAKGGRPRDDKANQKPTKSQPKADQSYSVSVSSSSSVSSSLKDLKHIGQNKDFDQLWDDYPRKEKRKTAEGHYNATVKNEQDLLDIKIALGNYKAHVLRERSNGHKDLAWQQGGTWFNNWKDYVEFDLVEETAEEGYLRRKKERKEAGLL